MLISPSSIAPPESDKPLRLRFSPLRLRFSPRPPSPALAEVDLVLAPPPPPPSPRPAPRPRSVSKRAETDLRKGVLKDVLADTGCLHSPGDDERRAAMKDAERASG